MFSFSEASTLGERRLGLLQDMDGAFDSITLEVTLASEDRNNFRN